MILCEHSLSFSVHIAIVNLLHLRLYEDSRKAGWYSYWHAKQQNVIMHKVSQGIYIINKNSVVLKSIDGDPYGSPILYIKRFISTFV